MFVGLNLFSMICTRVLRSTPGNSTSTDAAIVDALSLSCWNRGWDGSYVPGALGSLILVRSCSLCFLSSANWLSSIAILLCVGLCGWGWVPQVGKGGCWVRWGVGLKGFWLLEVSWRTTRSTISCSCERRSSRIVLRLIGMSDGERDKVWLSTSLDDIGVAGCGEIVFEGWECEIFIRSLLGEACLYWGVLASGSSLLLHGELVCSVLGVL